MSRTSFALFPTSVGACAIAWSERGVTSLLLPETDEASTRRKAARVVGEQATEEKAPPPWVGEAMKMIALHLDGTAQDLRAIRLDMSAVPPFYARVYEASREVEPGRTVGYAELARTAGSPNGSRAVGQAMAKNPFAVIVPCHRVLAAGGKPGGFSAYGGAKTKQRILLLEGVAIGTRGEFLTRSAEKKGPGPGSQTSLFGADDAARALSAADKALGRVIEKVGPLGLQVEPLESPFQALARSIVYQQLHGKAAAAILKRVHDAHGGKRTFTPAALLEMDEALLRGAGLSRSKMAALQDLAKKTLDGTVPTARALARASDEEIIERLVTIRGVGRWTVEMLLIFRLGRPDVLPVDDFGVRKGMQRMLKAKELPSRAEVAARGERWRPYRSAASWYLWRASELPVA